MEDTNERAVLSRRRAITLLSGAAIAGVVGCSSSDDKTAAGAASTSSSSSPTSSPSSASSSSSSSAASAADVSDPIPEETAGPYPGDGSNGPNVLTQDGVVRSDITRSFGSLSGTATGVPTMIELTIVDTAKSGAPYEGAAVYIWHCDQAGRYSLYSQGATTQNYLRGVQAADANGKVTFTTIFPACYSGRWPHVHFEVYPSLAEAKSVGNKIATSQLALPEAICDAVYATSGYEQSVQNMKGVSLSRDMVFSDGADKETPSVEGSVDSGITFRLTVPV